MTHRNPSSTPPPDEVIPREIAEQVLSMGRVEWGETDEFTASGHLAHLEETLRITREHFNFEDVPVPMHGLYLEGTETVLCHTGTSPNSGPNAQALAGAWNWLHDQCLAALAARSNQERTVGDAEVALATLLMMRSHCEMNDVATPRVMEKLNEAIDALSHTSSCGGGQRP